jgi:hypothetical protein
VLVAAGKCLLISFTPHLNDSFNRILFNFWVEQALFMAGKP